MVEKKRRNSAADDGESATAAPGSLRGRLPQMSGAQAHAWRILFAEPRIWSLGEGAQLLFSRGTGTGGEAFAVEADGTPMQVRIDSAQSTSELHWSDYRGRARMLAWSLANESALRQLSDAIGAALLPVEAQADAHRDDAPIWLDFHGDDEHGIALLRGALQLPVDWIARLLSHAQPVYDDDPLPDPGRWLPLPAPISLRCAGPSLDPAQWQALAPGDVIVISRGRPPELEARAAGRAWSLVASEHGWQVSGAARTLSSPQDRAPMNETTASDDTVVADQPEHGEKAERHPAHDLPVQLAFEIGTQELSVGELAGLQPGYVFELPTRLEGRNVTVRANGRVAGQGELVAVGDTFGVRLLSWS